MILLFHIQGIHILNINNSYQLLLFFSLSPDLNLDENVGKMIKIHVRNQRPKINSNEELCSALMLAYESLTNNRQFFINLIESMPRRIEAVIGAEGQTKY